MERRELIERNRRDLLESGKSSEKTSLEQFSAIWAELCAAHPRLAISAATLLVYYSQLRGFHEEALREAVSACLRELKFFPTIAEIFEQIANPPACSHHLKQAELRQREEIIEARERASSKTLEKIKAEIGDLQSFRQEVAEEKARQIRETDLPAAEAKLAEIQDKIQKAKEELRDVQKQCQTEARRLQLLDQHRFLAKMDETNPQ